uniref:Tn3 transposase DDE domain-containing protein n=1 Tax=Cupriavidus taiwanensis TaxID=164546 RepID=A0A375HCB4_9BURK|nr:transposase [Cupriavidus taiwanensis]SPD48945.1 protein of unknown function [Cupriavidus taiwanensis]
MTGGNSTDQSLMKRSALCKIAGVPGALVRLPPLRGSLLSATPCNLGTAAIWRPSERELYLPRGLQVTNGLSAAVSHEIALKAIGDGWDGLLRLIASIHSGRASAIVALQRFGSAAQGDPIHRAADHLGKMLRTFFLCDFFSNTEFRRELRTLLNRGESVHQLQRACQRFCVQGS